MNQEQVASLLSLTRTLEQNQKIDTSWKHHCTDLLHRLCVAVRDNQLTFLVIAVHLWDIELNGAGLFLMKRDPIYEFLRRVEDCALLDKTEIWATPVPILK